MDDSKVKDFPAPRRSTEREASQRLAEMMALLDHLEDANGSNGRDNAEGVINWPPLDRYGQPMRIGISSGDPIIPLVESEADWDRATVEREDLFERRFGFAWPHRFRVELMQLKHDRELTDREIRWLHKTGNLHRHQTGVRFSSSRFVAVAGWLVIAFMTFLLLLLVLAVPPSKTLTLNQLIGAIAVTLTLVGVALGAYKTYVVPWNIYRRSR